MRLAAARPDPIPVYAEMSSVNPVFVFPGALRTRAPAIAEGLHASFTLGVGQFCTNPGVVLVEAGAAGDALVERLAELTRGTPAAAMLSTRLCANYREGLERLQSLGTRLLAQGPAGEAAAAGRAALHEIDAPRVVAEPRLLAEVFGPSTLVVRYTNLETLEGLVDVLEGQLTATVHAEPEELASQRRLLERLARKAGRLVFNQFPTGVEVNHAMVHGGPFPATSDGRSTSVGTRAIERFSRLVAYQNFPQQALPEELQDANPRSVRRMLDGVLSGA
jgi:alpha-ketoglutaric semialdehyde dehydrogenase